MVHFGRLLLSSENFSEAYILSWRMVLGNEEEFIVFKPYFIFRFRNGFILWKRVYVLI